MRASLERRVGEELQVLRVLGGSQCDLCWDGGNSDDPNVRPLKVTKVLVRYENRI